MPSQIGHLDERSNRGLKKKKAGLIGIGMRLRWPNSGQTLAICHPSQRNTGSGSPGHPTPRVLGRQHLKTREPSAWRSPGALPWDRKAEIKMKIWKEGGGERDAEKPGSGTREGKPQPTVDASYGISIEKRSKADTLKEARLEAEFPPQVALPVVLEKGMATHPSILAWRIPMDRGAWRLHPTGSQESDMT